MIVKFLKRGSGSCRATMNYLMGTKNDREGAKLLAGQPELTQRLSDSLSFKNRYTVGVLSFEETNLPNEDKRAIMESFESNLFAGLEKDQYNITWIEHTDKNRLELNFVIANTELTTGKHLQPYYDKVDRPLVENWKQVTNHKYQLTDPYNPEKAQAVKILNRQNLPQDVRKVKEQIGQVITKQIEQGNITDRKGVIDTLGQAGFEVVRQTDKSISIKNPDGKRNIRLEGVIYENRQFGQEFAEKHSRARQDYAEGSAERYRTAFSKLQRAIEVKQERNKASFGREYQDYQREQNRLTAGIGMENDTGSIDGRFRSNILHPIVTESMARIEPKEQENRVSRDHTADRTISFAGSGISESGDKPKPRQEYLDNRQEPQESPSRQNDQWRAEPDTGVSTDAKRFFNTLQRAGGRVGEQKLTAATTDRAIDHSQSSITQVEHRIRETDKNIRARERATSDHQQQAEQFAQRSLEAVKAISCDRGMER